MLKKPIEFERMADEFRYLIVKYPSVAFNWKSFQGQPWGRAQGKRHLYATEGENTVPLNYDLKMIREYETFITPNSKFKALHPELNIVVTSGPMRTDDFYDLDGFPSYEERINGIASFLTRYHTGRDGDILHMRHDGMCNMFAFAPASFKVHAYGPVPYGPHQNYFPDPGQGIIPRSLRLLKSWEVMSHYRFCWCPEPIYHPLWSWDWVTERVLNCWKTKTVPVYYGAYNVEQRIPMQYTVDFRVFNGDYKALLDYLLSMPRQQWVDMTEGAFEYEKTCRIGNIEDIEAQLASLK